MTQKIKELREKYLFLKRRKRANNSVLSTLEMWLGIHYLFTKKEGLKNVMVMVPLF